MAARAPDPAARARVRVVRPRVCRCPSCDGQPPPEDDELTDADRERLEEMAESRVDAALDALEDCDAP